MLEHVFSAHACRWCGWYGDGEHVPSKEELARHIWATHLTDPRFNFSANDAAVWWHPNLNGDKMPWDGKLTSEKSWVWCPDCGHQCHRRACRAPCGFCSHQVQPCKDDKCLYCLQNSFAKSKLAVEWNKDLNNGLRPRDVWAGSGATWWFTCETCGHNRKQRLADISAGQGCGFCNRKQKPCRDDTCAYCPKYVFAGNPMASEWNTKRNGGLMPRDMWAKSNRKFWFTCPSCKHDRCQSLVNVSGGKGCGYCTHKLPPCGNVACDYCNSHTFSNHPMAVEWNMQKNYGKRPRDVWLGSGFKIWLKCQVCTHDRHQYIYTVTQGIGCGYCARQISPCCDDACDWCATNSFASHPMAVQWNVTKNAGLKPRDVWPGDNSSYWFTCTTCSHDRLQKLNGVSGKDTGCGFCSHHVKPCADDECDWCARNTFISHPRSVEWNIEKNAGVRPRDVWASGKYWLTCPACKHDRLQFLTNVTKGRGCGYCAHHIPPCSSSSCDWCLQTSFASHPMAVEWHWKKNGTLQPRDVWVGSASKVWLMCKVCLHARHQAPYSVITGVGCPMCRNKTERKIHEFTMISRTVQRDFRAEWCRNPTTNRHLPFDMICDNRIIECDGDQHFRNCSKWGQTTAAHLNERIERDVFKIWCALRNSHHVRRLYQPDVFHDRFDWRAWLDRTDEWLCNVDGYWLVLPDHARYDAHVQMLRDRHCLRVAYFDMEGLLVRCVVDDDKMSTATWTWIHDGSDKDVDADETNDIIEIDV